MAAYTDLLDKYFPDLDPALSSYVNGVLGNSDDLNSGDEVYEAIGEILQEVDESRSSDEIRDLCSSLYSLLSGSNRSADEPLKALSEPVHLANAVNERASKENTESIWLVKDKAALQYVDQKKLLKAEQLINKKQEKKIAQENNPSKSSNMVLDEASTSQQINRKEAKFDASGNNRSYDIRIANFDVAFGEKSLLVKANLNITFGRRYGFIGRNGLGKTTVLRLLFSRELKIPSHIRVLYVEQEVLGYETTALQSVLESDERREALLKRERELTSLHSGSPSSAKAFQTEELSQIYHELEAIGSDTAPSRAAVVLSGLGFTPTMQKMATKEFSGGWRMRLALARALFSKPDLLLLDEPTNMLDMKAILWLERYLVTLQSSLLVVSHDRDFLNSVATDILHLNCQRIDTYSGNYEEFYKLREDRLKNQQREYEAQKQYREHAQVFIDKFRYNAKRASLVQSKLKQLAKLPELKPVEKESEVVIKFCNCEALSPPILQMDEVCYHYVKEKPVFRNICVNANLQSRICIVGDNGAGKTTLLKLLLGLIDPVTGVRHAHRNLRMGYFSQHHVDQLDMDVSSLQLMATRYPGKSSEMYRSKLGSFGISGDLALRPVVTLSGGQKSRVAFSLMDMMNPNFLVLDEPTNHLDMETIEALADALKKFQGGVILVSHDKRLIRSICNELWLVASGSVTVIEGGLDKYRKMVETELELR